MHTYATVAAPDEAGRWEVRYKNENWYGATVQPSDLPANQDGEGLWLARLDFERRERWHFIEWLLANGWGPWRKVSDSKQQHDHK